MSVVIPVLDDARVLEPCLRALAAQTVPPHEVIVVDNGCTDDSVAVARRHGATVLHEPVRGIGAAAARGYDAATGALIGRIDADTVVPPEWVAVMTAALRDGGPDAVTGRGRFADGGWSRWLIGPYLGGYYLLTAAAIGHRPLWGSSMAMRREVWQRVGEQVHRWDAEVHDDMALSFALGPGARVAMVRDAVVDVSARSIRGGRQWRRRVSRAHRTIALAWQVAPPWERWRARFGRARAGS